MKGHALHLIMAPEQGGGGKMVIEKEGGEGSVVQDPPASSAWVSLKMSAGLEAGGEEEGGEGRSKSQGNIAQDPPHSSSDMASGKQLSCRSQNLMRQMLADLKVTTGQGNAPAPPKSAQDKFLDEQSLRVHAARICRSPTQSADAHLSSSRCSSRASTPPSPSSPQPDSTSQLVCSPTRRRPLGNQHADVVRNDLQSGWVAGPRTSEMRAGSKRPPVGAALKLQGTGSSPPQADEPHIAAAAGALRASLTFWASAADEEITCEGEIGASHDTQHLARLPSQPTPPQLGQGFPVLDKAHE